jgi:hypothetical protein
MGTPNLPPVGDPFGNRNSWGRGRRTRRQILWFAFQMTMIVAIALAYLLGPRSPFHHAPAPPPPTPTQQPGTHVVSHLDTPL